MFKQEPDYVPSHHHHIQANNDDDTAAAAAVQIKQEDDPNAGRVSSDRTHTHYCKKDGLYYRTYDLMVQANKRANEKKLKELGLEKQLSQRRRRGPSKKKTKLAPTSLSMASVSSSTDNNNIIVETQEPTRRSKRIRKEPAPYSDDLFLYEHSRSSSNGQMMTTPPKKRIRTYNRPVTPDTMKVSAQDRSKIVQLLGQKKHKDDNDDDKTWLRDMEEYLDEVESLSPDNRRSVMRQVERLSSGRGVTYRHWDEGVVFGKGETVDLSWDMEVLYDRAVAMEDQHGRDLGNGWLLRHPIKKMNNFQRFLLEQQN